MLIPLSMGLPVIDESLAKLLAAMETFPKEAALGNTLSFARMLGLLLALCVGSYECWMMMLGRRGMDVMKLARIIGISICITCSSWICNALLVPGKSLEATTLAMAQAKNKEVQAFETKVAKAQTEYLDSIRSAVNKIEQAKKASDSAEDTNWWRDILNSVKSIGDKINNFAKQSALLLETKIAEIINEIVRFVAQVIFQMAYYGVLLGQRIFLAIMIIFAPIEFALSLAPPFRAAWSQWMSKFLSLSLWGFVVYMSLYYLDFVFIYCLEQDLTAYQALTGKASASGLTWSDVGALGLQGIGTTCIYVMSLFAGAYIIRLAPEVASWLIPGGVSSGYSNMIGAKTSQVAGAAAGAATSVVAKGLGIK